MKKIKFSILTALIFVAGASIRAQTGCPGCVTAVPPGLPADTVYLPPIPSGQVGAYYDQDVSFRMPKTTTPVAAIDSTTAPGITINSIEVLSVEGLPPGLSWQVNQTVFPVATQTDGCIKICGTPTLSDSFVLTVKLKATIFIFTQETSFPMRMYIAPGVNTNDGFTMSNPTGCGSTTVTFTNNIPSNGQEGYSYEWIFGDGFIYTGENPPPHTYSTPGNYTVHYTANIDTSGYVLNTLMLTDVDCGDLAGLGAPDLYLSIKDSVGTVVFSSGPAVDNASLPILFQIGIPLGPGNYTLEVYDEDSGLEGGDDACGTFVFTVAAIPEFTSGGLSGLLDITRPVSQLHFSDEVTVYTVPETPELIAPKGYFTCSNQAPLPFSTPSTGNISWWKNGEEIAGVQDSVYQVSESGQYQVAITSEDGCKAYSEPADVIITLSPPLPIFVNNNNLLTLYDTLALPGAYQLDWYLNGQDVDAHGFWLCTFEAGTYMLVVTDMSTQCTSTYSLATLYNPNADCTTGVSATLRQDEVVVYPNPATDRFFIKDIRGNLQKATLWDLSGHAVLPLRTPTGQWSADCSQLPSGYYRLELQFKDGVRWYPLVIQR